MKKYLFYIDICFQTLKIHRLLCECQKITKQLELDFTQDNILVKM